MTNEFDENKLLRYSIYALLIVATLSTSTARIMTARSTDRHTPFFSANDRSRWSAISAVVDEGTYQIDNVRKRPGWKSIDMVRHVGRDGKQHYYSSKPPLFITMLAAEYYVIKSVFGINFEENVFAVARLMLWLTNIPAMLVLLVLMVRFVEDYGESDFGRIFVIGSACFATFLTTFAISLNNHLPAAVSVIVCIYCLLQIWQRDEVHWLYYSLAGASAAFAAANELPALSFLALVGAGLLWFSPRKTLIAFAPAVVLVAAAFFLTNYIAHDSLRPPYAHRNPGDNWYDYPGSYWMSAKQGVDQGEPSRLVYGFHVLIGHHGIFSLTPIWLLSLLGIGSWTIQREDLFKRAVAAGTLLLMLVCLIFYIGLRPEQDRNYGGVTSGFRWMFWFIPLWLVTMIPAADWISENTRRKSFALILLGMSVLSAQFAAGNPWSHPWIYQLQQYVGYFNH